MRLSLTLIAWGVLSNCFAQVKAPSTRIEISRPVQVQDDWVKHRPIVLEDGRILVVECTSHLPSKDGTSFSTAIYSADGMLEVEGGGSFDPGDGELHDIMTCLTTRSSLVVLHRIMKPKTGLVRYMAERFSLETLNQQSAPVEVARIPFDPNSFANGNQPGVLKHGQSADMSKLFLYYDDIMLENVKLFFCWVFDSEFMPIWNAAYRIPAQAFGFKSTVFFSDDASVYLQCIGVELTEDNTKTRADGSTKVNHTANVKKFASETIYRLNGEVFQRLPTVSMPSDFEETSDLVFALRGSTLCFAALEW
jgi:hypothetical protein